MRSCLGGFYPHREGHCTGGNSRLQDEDEEEEKQEEEREGREIEERL